jgi:transcriptional regulator GlxA family with amidase domain
VSLSGERSVIDPVIEQRTGCRSNNTIITRFLEFLTANPKRPLCLLEICAALGVSERTLRAACERHLGMGPIRYLNLRRMQQAREALLCAEVTKTTVTRIAVDHGFYELGRFAAAYRALFCEPPSRTLRRAAVRADSTCRPLT